MALWHRARMSSFFGGSWSWTTSVALVCMSEGFWVSGVSGLLVFELGAVRLAVFLRRVIR